MLPIIALAIFLCVLPVQMLADDNAIAQPEALVVAGDLSATQREVLLTSARKFYQFWATGDESLLRAVISDHFVDHTLPPGRPQGPTGPADASKTFRLAVPDLKIAVRQQILVGDRVVSHLAFSGHFTGSFQGVRGHGQTVDFIATDILRLENGKITDNWHLEDNLTFLQQIDVLAKSR